MKKIVVVGFGFMGKTHAGNILKDPGLELVAIVKRNPGTLSGLNDSGNFATGTVSRESLAAVRLYAGLEECLAREKPDACVISVHTDLHFGLAWMALQNGVSVFLEKPFALETAHCQELIDLATQKNLLLMVGHVVRFMPAYRTLKAWIDNRDFGELKFLSMSRFSGLPAWGQWKEKQENFGSSGGALFDLVIHDIDFARWALGDPDEIASVCIPGKLSNQDYINATWKYKNGRVVKIEGGNIFHSAFPFHTGFIAGFEKASILYSSLDPLNIKVTTDSETTFVPAGDANVGFSAELQYFTECLRSGEFPSLCSPDSALKTIELCYKHII